MFKKKNEFPPEYLKPSEDRRYLFGGKWLTFEEARNHFVFMASTGGGKTLNIKMLLRCITKQRAKEGAQARALIYDSKTDLVSFVATLIAKQYGLKKPVDVLEHIIIANPFDARCSAWAMAEDITDAAMADDIAAGMIPEPPNSNNPFFSRVAKRLLEGVIIAFIENAGKNWRMRDLVEAVTTKERLAAVLESCEDTRPLLTYFKPEKTFSDVFSTLSEAVLSYRVIAAAWEMAVAEDKNRTFSLDGWLSSDQLIVMGNSTRKKAPISRLNNLLFSEATKIMLDRPGEIRVEDQNETWFLLDEASELGKMDTLGDLMIRGRSKSAAVALGFQDIGDLDALYTKERARSIVGQPHNVAIMHINDASDDMQRWCSRVVGERKYPRRNRSSSSQSSIQPSQQGMRLSTSESQSTAEQIVTEPLWLPSQFGSYHPEFGLPRTNRTSGMKGLYQIEGRWFQETTPGDELFSNTESESFVGGADHVRYPDHVPWLEPLKLKRWSEADATRLGIPELVAVLQAEQPKTARPKKDVAVMMENIANIPQEEAQH